jgi:hypothetical protein
MENKTSEDTALLKPRSPRSKETKSLIWPATLASFSVLKRTAH